MSVQDEVEDPGNAVGGYAPALHSCPHADANIVQLPYGVETKDLEPGQPLTQPAISSTLSLTRPRHSQQPLTRLPTPNLAAVGWLSDDNKCVDCDNAEENWLCLSCHTVHCGRFASAHARKHVTASGHLIACGLADLSFWCYQCDSYLHHLTIEPVYHFYRTLHVMKFGEEAVEVMEFTQPGVFRIEEGDEAGSNTTADESKEMKQAEEPLSLSAGMGGVGREDREIRLQDESKSGAAAKDTTASQAARP